MSVLIERCRRLQVKSTYYEPVTLSKYGITANHLELCLPFPLNYEDLLNIAKETQGYIFRRIKHSSEGEEDWFENRFLLKRNDTFIYCVEMIRGSETILSVKDYSEGLKCLDTIIRTKTMREKLKKFWNVTEEEADKRLRKLIRC